jgi:hypothetical protein
MNFSVDSRVCCAASYSAVVCSTSAAQQATGATLTSITPGSGVTRNTASRGSRGGS